MDPFRFIQLATLCVALMCSAAVLQVPDTGFGAALPSPEIRFKSETFPLERLTPVTVRSSPR